MVKAHSPINWQNEPSRNTPINEANLNKMDSTIGVLDDRIIEQDTVKLDKSTANTMVQDVSLDESTGIFTITFLNGSTKTLDTKLEKIATNFRYDYSTQTLILTLIDGTTQSIDMSALVTQYEFTDSATLDFSVAIDGKITATIKNGSITEDMLQPNYLAEIKVETAKSAQSMANAQISENNAKQSELNAKESEEKAKEYSENAQPIAQTVNGTNPTINSTNGKLIYLNNKGYTSQDGEPTPDTPIHIASNGDKGYFDGKLEQAYHSASTGEYGTGINHITNTNSIECKSGDIITVEYERLTPFINIVFYDANNQYLYGNYAENINKYSATAPQNAKYVYFTIREDGITPSTAKHISVTINGQYALRVKTQNKNLFAFGKTAIDKTSELRPTPTQRLIMSSVDGNSNTIKCQYNGGNWSYGFLVIDGIDGTKDYTISYKVTENTTSYTPSMDIDTERSNENQLVLCPGGGNGGTIVSNSNYFVLSDIQLEQGTVATPYEPHQESEALIPVSAPLYEGDYIEVYADGSGREYRKMGNKVYDGSSDENWTLANAQYNNPNTYYVSNHDMSKNNPIIYCDRYKKSDNLSTSMNNFEIQSYHDFDNSYPNQNWVYIRNTNCANVNNLKSELANNPIHVVYEKTTPTSTPLTAEQVAEFMKLQTYKGVTHINADGEVTVRYYANTDSGDTVGMLHGMIEDVENKSTYTSGKEQQVGYFLGKPLYRATIERTYSSINVITTGVDTPLNSSDGLISDGSHLISGIDELVKADSLVETSTYKYVNALSIKKDKTGYYYVRNIVGEAMPATRLVITFYYTKY